MAKLRDLLLMKVIEVILKTITPACKKFVKKQIKTLEQKAKNTENPYDDLLVQFLKSFVA